MGFNSFFCHSKTVETLRLIWYNVVYYRKWLSKRKKVSEAQDETTHSHEDDDDTDNDDGTDFCANWTVNEIVRGSIRTPKGRCHIDGYRDRL